MYKENSKNRGRKKTDITNKEREVILELANYKTLNPDKVFEISRLKDKKGNPYEKRIITKEILKELGWWVKKSHLEKKIGRLNITLIPSLKKKGIILEKDFKYQYNKKPNTINIIKLKDTESTFIRLLKNSIENQYIDKLMKTDYYDESTHKEILITNFIKSIEKFNHPNSNISDNVKQALKFANKRKHWSFHEEMILSLEMLFYEYLNNREDFKIKIDKLYKIFEKGYRANSSLIEKQGAFMDFLISSLNFSTLKDVVFSNKFDDKLYSYQEDMLRKSLWSFTNKLYTCGMGYKAMEVGKIKRILNKKDPKLWEEIEIKLKNKMED